ncbi:MAG: tetratricopeptide repeat protein [Oceanihabitans sp.]
MRLFILVFLLISSSVFSQKNKDAELANQYFKNGKFEKARIIYQKIVAKNPNHHQYLLQLVKTHQQLEQFNEAENLLKNRLAKRANPIVQIDLGYNYSLKKDSINANKFYQKAIDYIDERPIYTSAIGQKFEQLSLLNLAVTSYLKGMRLSPELNYNFQLARIYGEQGNIQEMFACYTNYLQAKPDYINNIKRVFNNFISEDKSNPNNTILRKVLLKKIQATPDLLFNDLLSWLFIQQKEYYKAFTQEKAIFKRLPESLIRIENLALIAAKDNHNEIAKEIFNYLINTAQEPDRILEAEYQLLQIETKESTTANYQEINSKYLQLLEHYQRHPKTLKLQIAYAHFLAFKLHNTKQASAFLKETLALPLSPYQEAQVKLQLADILVFEEKFNEALIFYTQIQRSLKNSPISQEARFKVAKTSYYKGDFKWAESQLKILKSSTSQLIANDALDLMLLITDNKVEDSSQTALKMYAKADLLAFQNKPNTAIKILNQILEAHKTETIIDQALYMQANLFENLKLYTKAEANYLKIITDFKKDILADDAYFAIAELYKNKLAQPEKAKEFYEQIIFNYQDSIYYVEARKKYRMLRGDAIN